MIGRLTTIRPATDDDVELLVAWHADPEVARFWDDEVFTREEMAARLARPGVEGFIVEAGGEPVGYLQVHDDDADGDGGLDMFLVPGARGRGLGPDAARAMTEHLLAEGRTRVTVDPYEWNEPAIRAWRRAGFEPVGERKPDEWWRARWLLMEFRG
jgi:aminoglycoside 6'-N-acetyltransferase